MINGSGGYGDATQDVLHLHSVRSCGATNAKDKINALARFLSPEMQACLMSLTHGLNHNTQEFYRDVAKFQLECHNMDVLGDAGLCQKSWDHHSMPSWVPDWTTGEWTHNLFFLNRRSITQSGKCLYQASGQSGAQVDFSEDGSLLRVKGKVIDEIDGIGQPPEFTISHDRNPHFRAVDPVENMRMVIALCGERRRHIDDCLRRAKAACQVRYRSSLFSAFYHTMFRGIIQEGKGSTASGPDRKATDTELAAHFEDFFQNMEELDHPQLLDAIREQQQILEEMKEGLKSGISDKRWSYLTERNTSLGHITKAIMGIPASHKVTNHIQDAFKGRLFFTTKDGYMGLGPCTDLTRTKTGDRICVVYGCCSPYVIRPMTSEGQDCYELVGETYVHGLMEGEALNMDEILEEKISLR